MERSLYGLPTMLRRAHTSVALLPLLLALLLGAGESGVRRAIR